MSSAPAAHLDDFEVGQRRRSDAATISDDTVAACAQVLGPRGGVADDHAAGSAELQQLLGIRLRAQLLSDLDLPFGDLAAPSAHTWTVRRGLAVADTVHLETAVTRCRHDPDRSFGTVNWHTRLVGGDGLVRHEGTSSAQVPARTGSEPPSPHRDFASPAWGAAVAERVGANPGFADATRTFDGAIELQAGHERVQLRVYRGDVLAASRSTPSGPTFTVAGEESAWLELAEAPRNDYIRHAMQGRFQARGNTHEYLRLTKAMVVLWDTIRELADLDGGRG